MFAKLLVLAVIAFFIFRVIQLISFAPRETILANFPLIIAFALALFVMLGETTEDLVTSLIADFKTLRHR